MEQKTLQEEAARPADKTARPEVEVVRPDIIEEGPSLPAILTDNFIELFEAGVVNYKRWISICYKLTKERHWINHGTAENPKYYLQSTGAEALMTPLGCSHEISVRREEKTDDKGKFYVIWVEGWMESRALARRGWYIGYCDSRDKFFNARPGWVPSEGEGDIRKAAISNWEVNAVTRLAGIRDPDPELLTNAGLDSRKITQIDYSGKHKSASKEPITEPQIKRLLAIAGKAGLQETPLVQKICEAYDYIDPLQDDGGTWNILKQIRRWDYDAIVTRTEKAGKSREPGGEG